MTLRAYVGAPVRAMPDWSRVEIVTGRERRRRWSVEDKLRIVAETHEPGARVGDVAARHGGMREPGVHLAASGARRRAGRAGSAGVRARAGARWPGTDRVTPPGALSRTDIGLGTVALRRGAKRRTQLLAYVAALAAFASIYSVARAHHPLGAIAAYFA